MSKPIVDKCSDTLDMFCDPRVRITTRPNGRIRVDHMNFEKSMTQQCFTEASDVNRIMARWLTGSGENPHRLPDFNRYRDVSHGMDYQAMVNVVSSVNDDFDSLDADVRARFKNDPSLLLDFVSDPANINECISLGLIEDDFASMVDKVPSGDVKSPSAQSSLDVTVLGDPSLSS